MVVVITKDGTEKRQGVGRIEADGTLRIKDGKNWRPIVIAAACRDLGVDPQQALATASPASVLMRMGDNSHGYVAYTQADWRQKKQQELDARQATLEANVAGLSEALRLEAEVSRYRDGQKRQFEQSLATGRFEASHSVIEDQLAAHLSAHPRAALYLAAQNQLNGTSWADNTGRGAAAKKAIDILSAGGTLDDATTALNRK